MFGNFIILYASIAIVRSGKILVVMPTPVISHQVVFRPLIQELIKRDHEVIVITTDPIYQQGGSPDNLSEINLHDLSYKLWFEVAHELAKIDQSNLDKMRVAYRSFTEIFIEQLKDKSVLQFLNDTTLNIDLLMVVAFTPATLIFSHIFKTPVIFMSTFGALPGNMKMIGSENHPLLYPTHYHAKLYNLTILEKIYEMFIEIAYNNLHEKQELVDDTMLKDIFGVDIPTLNELKNNVHMLFLNVHPIWVRNQPVSPNVIYTWSVHRPSEKELPQELQSYLDSSKHGVIYMSFGSIFKTSVIPPDILDIFLKVFSRLPYDILWKWDTEILPGKSENIKLSKWFPQYDVLRHPNLKLFITHGGLQSTNEAINAGVPVIGIPQFSDQEYNTEKYAYFKIGLKLDYKSLTIEKFEKAIMNILTNYNSYKNNIAQLRTQMYDQPKPALDHAICWIEHVLRHGGVQHLRAPAANMSWVEYYELEIVFLVLSAFIVIGSVLLVTVYTCLLNILRLINFKTNQLLEILNMRPRSWTRNATRGWRGGPRHPHQF